MYKVIVITLSDKGYAGVREDRSGPMLKEMMTEAGYDVVDYILLPDERGQLADTMKAVCDEGRADLILTTGGTGFSPRDYTPEATLDIADRQVPGIAEAMRAYSMQKTNRAMLSRAVAAIRARTLIINLPGSPKAARENLECVLPALGHGLEVLTGKAVECASQNQ